MEWTQLLVKTSMEAKEAVANLLMENGAGGLQEIETDEQAVELVTYFPAEQNLQELALELESKIKALTTFGLNPGQVTVSLAQVDDASWQTAWEKYYHPTRLSRYLTVVPAWEDYQAGDDLEKLVYLNPGKAFGTGTHPTTRLTITAMETVMRGGETVIDVGTGSGVLAIVAKLLGAKSVLATDIDEEAIASAKTNLELNPQALPIELKVNNLLDGIEQQVDLILANILPEFLLPLMPQAYANLNEGGKVILSGIISEQKAKVVQALTTAGFELEASFKLGDWYGLVAQKPGKGE